MARYGVRIYNPDRAVTLAIKAGMSVEEFNKLYDKMNKMLSVVDTDKKDKKDRVIKLMIDHILDDILYKKNEKIIMKLKDLKDFQINGAISALYIDNVGKVFDIEEYGNHLDEALKEYEDYEISDIAVGTDKEDHIWVSIILKELEEKENVK